MNLAARKEIMSVQQSVIRTRRVLAIPDILKRRGVTVDFTVSIDKARSSFIDHTFEIVCKIFVLLLYKMINC